MQNFLWLDDEENRTSLFPIIHDDIWQFRKTIEGLHWTAQEVDLSEDKTDWEKKMNEDQRHFIKMQLAFFAQIDILVLDNLDENFGNEVDCLEAKMVYAAQKDQECTHAESYNLQVAAVMDGEERTKILNAVKTLPVVSNMKRWVKKWFDSSKYTIGERMVAFAAIEGVLFSASFASIQWLKELNLLKGIVAYNEFIVRDEGIHTLFTCLLIKKYLKNKPSQKRVEEIFAGVISVLDTFVESSLPVSMMGMNGALMKEYVRFQADCVITDMGYNAFTGCKNPFRYMDKLTMNEVAKGNFFEVTITQYQNIVKDGASKLKIDDESDLD